MSETISEQMMCEAATTMAELWGRYIKEQASDLQRQRFQQSIYNFVLKKFRQDIRFVKLSNDYHPDENLLEVVRAAGIEKKLLPCKTEVYSRCDKEGLQVIGIRGSGDWSSPDIYIYSFPFS